MMMQSSVTSVLAGIVAGLMGVTAAEAHASLSDAVPPVGGIVSTPPHEVRLIFSERVEPAFSGAELSTAEGQAITSHAAIDPGDNTQLVLSVPPLAPGRYKVRWHVVSADAHRIEGDYVFEIKPR
jgi:copper resistance protein C